LVNRKGWGGARPGDPHEAGAAHQPSALDAPDHQTPDVLVVAERDGLELKRRLYVDNRRGGEFEDGFEQRPQVRQRLVERAGSAPLLGGRKDDRKIQLLVIGSEVDEQVENLVDHLLGPLFGPIHLVDDDERAQTACERLADHEARLGHHALDGIHQQQDAIHHPEHPFHLAAEVGVTRRVDQVDPDPFEDDRSLLGVDRNAALSLQVLVVHHAFSDFLVGAKRTGLSQETVEQSRLAMVDVRNDCEVPKIFAGLLTHWARNLADESRAGRPPTGGSARRSGIGVDSARSNLSSSALGDGRDSGQLLPLQRNSPIPREASHAPRGDFHCSPKLISTGP
jgi:hypothetical protein